MICKKAVKALEVNGMDVIFRDVRADPLSEAELEELIAELEDRLVDRNSNDDRALNYWLKILKQRRKFSRDPN